MTVPSHATHYLVKITAATKRKAKKAAPKTKAKKAAPKTKAKKRSAFIGPMPRRGM
jgi:hypothetical protein